MFPPTTWYVGVFLEEPFPPSNFLRRVYEVLSRLVFRVNDAQNNASAPGSIMLGNADSEILTGLVRGWNYQSYFTACTSLTFLIGDHQKGVRIEGGDEGKESKEREEHVEKEAFEGRNYSESEILERSTTWMYRALR